MCRVRAVQAAAELARYLGVEPAERDPLPLCESDLKIGWSSESLKNDTVPLGSFDKGIEFVFRGRTREVERQANRGEPDSCISIHAQRSTEIEVALCPDDALDFEA